MIHDEAIAYEECGNCKHYQAYHAGEGGRPCRAWDPDQDDSKCACPGWKPGAVKTEIGEQNHDG